MAKDIFMLKVTFRRPVLDHLGAGPGSRLIVDLPPGCRADVHAAGRGHIDEFIGTLARSDEKTVSAEAMREATASGWAGKR